MMPRVIKVDPLPEYRLHVEFDDGVAGTIDLSGELDGEVFQPLRDEAVFRPPEPPSQPRPKKAKPRTISKSPPGR